MNNEIKRRSAPLYCCIPIIDSGSLFTITLIVQRTLNKDNSITRCVTFTYDLFQGKFRIGKGAICFNATSFKLTLGLQFTS